MKLINNICAYVLVFIYLSVSLSLTLSLYRCTTGPGVSIFTIEPLRMGPAYVLEAAIKAVDEANPGYAEACLQVDSTRPYETPMYKKYLSRHAPVLPAVDGEGMRRRLLSNDRRAG